MNQNQKIQEVKRVVKRLRQDYADDPNVISVGFGLAKRGGQLKDGITIIFLVKKKYPTQRAIESAGTEMIPEQIEGFETDVQVANPRPAQAGDRDEIKYDPLRGGVASSNAEEHILWFNGYGTLGILGTDNATGAPVALSNWHVWGDGGIVGDRIIQPGHPTGGDHVEAIGKVVACGPLVGSGIEWSAPSPLTIGLYTGAAAAGIAAAASDVRDPTRRGQDHTPVDPGERTTREWVDMSIEYPQLPLPGLPFTTDVKWKYHRETTARVLSHEVSESNVNTQFLLGKMVRTDKGSYQPGDTVRLSAAIWDYQPRACADYHVVAHLISHRHPDQALRVVLHPTTCPRTFPRDPPIGEEQEGEDRELCLDFQDKKLGQQPYKGAFDFVNYFTVSQTNVTIVDWFQPHRALQFPREGLVLNHEPANRIVAKVAQFTNEPVQLAAFNAAGEAMGTVSAPPDQQTVHELVIEGEGITRVVVTGGGYEGLLVSYCIHVTRSRPFLGKANKALLASVRREVVGISMEGDHLKAHRCCFSGHIPLPPDESPGKWDVHLTVQNLNNVPEGTPPEEAATTIGGHLLSTHAVPQLGSACLTIMLLDHVFDVI